MNHPLTACITEIEFLEERIREKNARVKQLEAALREISFDCYSDGGPTEPAKIASKALRSERQRMNEDTNAGAWNALIEAKERAEVRIYQLEAECFKLAANQCSYGYGDDYGNHKCSRIERLEEIVLSFLTRDEMEATISAALKTATPSSKPSS